MALHNDGLARSSFIVVEHRYADVLELDTRLGAQGYPKARGRGQVVFVGRPDRTIASKRIG